VELYEAGYNRVYDTLEPETNLNFVESIVADILDRWDDADVMCSYKLNREIGKYLHDNVQGRSILKSAYRKERAVFVPASPTPNLDSTSLCTIASVPSRTVS